MKSQNKSLNGLGLGLFFTGILLGMVFFTSLAWPYLEATFYFGYNGGAETKLHLTCPHILTPQDSGSVTAIVTNRVEKAINPIMQADFSGPSLRRIRTQPSIDPGKTQEIKWAVSTADVDFGHLILAQVYQFSSYQTPTATSNCGTLFLYLPVLTGMQVYILVLILSLILIATGLCLWLSQNWPLVGRSLDRFWGMALLAALVLLGILFGSLGQWLLSVLTLVLSILMFVIQVTRRFMPS